MSDVENSSIHKWFRLLPKPERDQRIRWLLGTLKGRLALFAFVGWECVVLCEAIGGIIGFNKFPFLLITLYQALAVASVGAFIILANGLLRYIHPWWMRIIPIVNSIGFGIFLLRYLVFVGTHWGPFTQSAANVCQHIGIITIMLFPISGLDLLLSAAFYKPSSGS